MSATSRASTLAEHSGDGAWEQIIGRLIHPTHPALALHHFTHGPIKKVLGLQLAYIARCCENAMRAASSCIIEKFKRTWEARLTALRALPDGTARAAAVATSPPELLIGIIGCGVIGMGVVRTLLDAGVEPSQLLISTRSTGGAQLRELAVRGAWVGFDNKKVAGAAHVLVFATLPTQLPDATREVQETITRRTLALSLVGGVPSAKLRSMLMTPHALQLHAGSERIRAALEAQASAQGPPGTTVAVAGQVSLSEPLPSSALASLAAQSLLADVQAADELAGLVSGSMLHGLELEDEEGGIGKRALLLGGSAPRDAPPAPFYMTKLPSSSPLLLGAGDGDAAAPAVESTIDLNLLPNTYNGSNASLQGDQVEMERLANVRTQFNSLATRALTQSVQGR
jgi:hypothetical protein